jgi:riboflavin kinase / FMN adenylyltransferase
MQTHRGVPARPLGPAVITIGSFDGVHLAHQRLFRQVVEDAGADAAPVAVTFEPHPRCVLQPDHCPRLLTVFDEKAALIEANGLSDLVVIPFDRNFSQKSPAEFMAWLSDGMEVTEVVAGYDFVFGRQRAGNSVWLRERGYRVVEVPQVEVDGRLVHSSAVRGLVGSGEVGAAAELLGRHYSLHGVVVEGHKRGRELGFPTANLAVDRDKAVPGPSAYAGWARTPWGEHMAAVSVGHQPTFGGGDLSIEAHLLDFDANLYGQDVEVRFVQRLHPDIRFPTVAALVEQIGQDVDDTRRLLAAG